MAKRRIPPTKGHWFVGAAVFLLRDPLGLLTKWAREHGDVVRVRFGPLDY